MEQSKNATINYNGVFGSSFSKTKVVLVKEYIMVLLDGYILKEAKVGKIKFGIVSVVRKRSDTNKNLPEKPHSTIIPFMSHVLREYEG